MRWNLALKIAAKPLHIKTWLITYYWQLIGTCHRPAIAIYHHRPPTTYRSPTISHDWNIIVRYDPSRSSKVDKFCFTWKGVCDFLLVIFSNLGFISQCFRDTSSFQLKNRSFARWQELLHRQSYANVAAHQRQEIWANAHETRESL